MFNRVAIVGVGLIGGSLGLALRERRLAREIVGVGRNPETLAKAEGLGAITEGTTDFAAGVAEADLIVLATPIGQILADMARLPALLKPDTIVTDVGSVKGEIALSEAARGLGGHFVPGHPMAGSERSGVEAARANLFLDATWALTPTSETDPAALHSVRELAMAVGARVITLTPEAHDRAVAVTSHLPHVLAYALASVAGDVAATDPQTWSLAAGSFRSGTRVARSSPAFWREITFSNRAALIDAVRASRAELDAALAALEAGDEPALEALFRRGYDALSDVAE